MKRRKPKIYGCGRQKITEDPIRCIETVFYGTFMSIQHQCSRKRGHGPNKLYCKQHDPKRVEAKREEKHKKWEEERKVRQHRFDREQEMSKLCKGVATHNLHKYKLIRKTKTRDSLSI